MASPGRWSRQAVPLPIGPLPLGPHPRGRSPGRLRSPLTRVSLFALGFPLYTPEMPLLSVLDLAPIVEGGTAALALHNSLDLARHVERLGYHRFWLAEHHNMPGIASSATAVAIGHVAAGTSTIRVGAGGVMLPNHSPLVIAEQYGTLATLFPGRIDLGVGRAPGADGLTMRALRRSANAVETFPQDVVELMSYLGAPAPGQPIHAVPGEGTDVPVWILGSSLFGATLAATLGLPYAFASHFAPAELTEALAIYRTRFRPSASLSRPYVVLGVNVVVAETNAEASLLQSSLKQAFAQLRRGMPGKLLPPVENYDAQLSAPERVMLQELLRCSFAGAVSDVERDLSAFALRTGADELMVSTHVFDHGARRRSFELLATTALFGSAAKS